MTTRYAAKHGAALVNTLNAIRERQPFNAGNLTATDDYYPTGILPHHWVNEFYGRDSRGKDHRPLYVVYSYETPIAWVTASGEWVVPAVKYSPTTTQHQSTVRKALGGFGKGLIGAERIEYRESHSAPAEVDWTTAKGA